MEFVKKLKQEQKKFETEKYHKQSMPEVKAYNLQYRQESGKYPYNSDIRDFIVKKEGLKLDSVLFHYLETEVYLSQHDIDADKKAEYKSKMLAEGWLELARETEYRGRAVLSAIKSADMFTHKVDLEGKIITNGDGYPFFVPKGKRSRGYYVGTLENAFYKPLK